jgi:hypothetical protein
MGEKTLLISLGVVAVFGIGLAMAQVPGGALRRVPLSEIQKEATVPVAQGVTLDFTDGGANKVTVQKSDDSSVVQITSKTNAVTLAPGTARVSVAVLGECPKPTGAQVVSCDPIPVFSVTIKVRQP